MNPKIKYPGSRPAFIFQMLLNGRSSTAIGQQKAGQRTLYPAWEICFGY